VQPLWLIKQALSAYRRQVNTAHLSQARLSMMTANINRGEKTPAFEDVADFLPYPSQWMIDNNQKLFTIPSSVAKEFLDTYQSFEPEVELAFTSWLTTIRINLIN